MFKIQNPKSKEMAGEWDGWDGWDAYDGAEGAGGRRRDGGRIRRV
jgi:hypothetical protein